ICAMVIAACDSGAATPATQGPTPLPADPVSVARLFLDDWTHGNYAEMYKLITRTGQVLSPSAFTEIYKNAESTMSVGSEGKVYELLEDQSFQQGTTYVVKYNMTFDSGSLGKFTDSNRTMRLVQVGDGWRVAWSQMDIFEGMAGGATLTLQPVL